MAIQPITDSLRNTILLNTGFFEGDDGYSNISGNFDGQGISFGILQYNFGQETLQPILRAYYNGKEEDLIYCFGQNKSDTLKNVVFNCSTTEQISWGDSISTSNGNVKTEWSTPFKALGKLSACISLQRSYASSYVDRAAYLAKKCGISSTQGYACLFDFSVVKWGLGSLLDYTEVKNSGTAELTKLNKFASKITNIDVKNRFVAIKDGSGYVHGKNYDISDFPNLNYTKKWALGNE